jgi:hypothetical protein
MQQITYAGGTFVTSDEIADALVDYAAALANAARAAGIDVPANGLPGGGSSLKMLVGPASQLLVSPVDSKDDAPDGDAFVKDVRERIEDLRRGWTRMPAESGVDWDL